jgi:hypothetical protein
MCVTRIVNKNIFVENASGKEAMLSETAFLSRTSKVRYVLSFESSFQVQPFSHVYRKG